MFKKSAVVKFKDSKVCILLSQIGNGDAFNKEFSQVTSEGYELKTTHPFASFKMLGTGGDLDHLFYFQKNTEMQKEQEEEIIAQMNNKSREEKLNKEKEEHAFKMRPKSTIVGNNKICDNCRNNNTLDAKTCKYCDKPI